MTGKRRQFTAMQAIRYLQQRGFLKGGTATKMAKCPSCSRLGRPCSKCGHAGGDRHG